MLPFVAKPGETIIGFGLNFVNRLATGETIVETEAAAGTGLTVVSASYVGTNALAKIDVGSDEGVSSVTFTIKGSAGSIRKATRPVIIAAASE